jgi:hypothetical protein
MAFASAGQVTAELERTVAELGKWLEVVGAGFEQLAA